MAEACASAEIRAEVCSDIFTAIDKGKTRAFSCLIVDWAEQPEASFLLKRARESEANHDTVAVAVVDRDPTQAELRDSRLDFLVHRPIAANAAKAVLAKACEKMQPMSAEDARESFEQERVAEAKANANAEDRSEVSAAGKGPKRVEQNAPADFPDENSDSNIEDESVGGFEEGQPDARSHAIGLRGVCAAVLVLAAAFLLWSSRDVILYLTRTPEGKVDVLREAVASLFDTNKSGAMPAGSAGSDAQQDAYFSRDSSSNSQTPALKVAATESTLAEGRITLPKAADFPLPLPVVERQEPTPVHIAHAPIPDSMRNSAPIERPMVVTVTPAQMMPVSAPQPQPAVQQFSEPVTVSEEAERELLISSVNPVYPPEALAQKLHGPVILQAVVGRDGGVQDLKIIRGYYLLGKAAIAAVKQWRFQPYTVNGHAASTQTVITINFNYPPG
jgi:TonB family protein